MAPNFNSPKQALEQGVCGQHGWSSRYFQDPDTSRWCVEVRWGVGSSQRQVFVSDDESDAASKPGIKKGHAAAATVALEGLTEILRAANVKPSRTIDETFGPRFDATCRVLGGGHGFENGWDALWACAPSVVAVDVEGNQRTPPVLVQVCARVGADTLCVLETPSVAEGLSENLRRLLDDDAIVKVFCDGTSGADKRSLGVRSTCNVLDLEHVATELAGATGVQRGLARILNLAWPDATVRVTKDAADKSSVKFFAAIERGTRPPLSGLHDIPPDVVRYAAMDAWCTLLAHQGLQLLARREGISIKG